MRVEYNKGFVWCRQCAKVIHRNKCIKNKRHKNKRIKYLLCPICHFRVRLGPDSKNRYTIGHAAYYRLKRNEKD